MGPASLQEERELGKKSKEEMEGYSCLMQAGSQLENTLLQVTVPVSMKEVGVGKTLVSSSPSQSAQPSVTFQKKL
ncbi:unnamed protein product [Menidia menidia]|uniref:(Atlantic silverside) hypothetical protein n=1 Tax=Menidia menidia TaxID=238744 RepID=A0A8S4BMQ4_9TELE|nr:unnamed protein product [Menidia menidia]